MGHIGTFLVISSTLGVALVAHYLHTQSWTASSRLHSSVWPSDTDVASMPRALVRAVSARVDSASSGGGLVERLERGIAAGISYLIRICDDHGKFVYLYRFRDDEVIRAKHYNIVRHAGSLYSLAHALEWCRDLKSSDRCSWTSSSSSSSSSYLGSDDDDGIDGVALEAAIRRAAQYLINEHIAPLPFPPAAVPDSSTDSEDESDETGEVDDDEDEEMLAVWSRAPETAQEVAKLGGAGIALAALCAVNLVMPGVVSLEMLQALASFIVFMQKDDGSFYMRYIPHGEEKGRSVKNHVLYYHGEAAVGLLMLYDQDRDPRWLHAAGRVLAFDAIDRYDKAANEVPTDHWAIMAISKFLRVHHECFFDGVELDGGIESSGRQLQFSDDAACPDVPLYTHAAHQLLDAYDYRSFKLHDESSVRRGGFDEMGATCWHSCLLEGMASFFMWIPPHMQRTRVQLASSMLDGADFLLRAQRMHDKKDKFRGGIPTAIARLSDDFARHRVRARKRDRIRIVQQRHKKNKNTQKRRRWKKQRQKKRKSNRSKIATAVAKRRAWIARNEERKQKRRILKRDAIWKRKRDRFNLASGDIRIDYVQHAMSALMRLHSLLLHGPLARKVYSINPIVMDMFRNLSRINLDYATAGKTPPKLSRISVFP